MVRRWNRVGQYAFHYGEKGIRCNPICPGTVATAIRMGSGVPSQTDLSRVMPFLKGSAPSRVVTPEELAATMIFSDAPHVVDDLQGQVRALWKPML